MAIKPTIYKANINLSDIDRNYYQEFNLTLALHPSETAERMMVRIIAFCLNADEDLAFTRGISSTDEPDIWLRSLDDQILHWIEVGQPDPARLKKAIGRSKQVSLYIFGRSADTWWQLNQDAIARLKEVAVHQIPWDKVIELSTLLDRTMKLNVTISDGLLFISNDRASIEVQLENLFPQTN